MLTFHRTRTYTSRSTMLVTRTGVARLERKTGQSGNPAGRPPDRLRKRIEAELEKIASSEPGKARTKLELLAENIVSDALRGDSQSRKLLIERLYPMLNRHEIAGAEGPYRAISLMNSGDLTTCYLAGAAESLLNYLPPLNRGLRGSKLRVSCITVCE